MKFSQKYYLFFSLIFIIFLNFSSHFGVISGTIPINYNFSTVDDIIENGIANHDYPSAVLVVGNDKDIIYQNSYGRLTYDDDAQATTMNTIYDLASVTKVIATTSAIMKLYDQGKIDLNASVIYSGICS